MYSDCSTNYWNKRKTSDSKWKVWIIFVVLILTLILLVKNTHKNRQYGIKQRMIIEDRKNTRPSPTEEEYRLCETNMRDISPIECAKLCHNEVGSIPRPLMYETCIHGCSRSLYSAAVIGCREGSIEKAFQIENQQQAANSCSRFHQVEPQPYVISTCRKYYREGTKTGRNLGYDFINKLIDRKWSRIRNEI